PTATAATGISRTIHRPNVTFICTPLDTTSATLYVRAPHEGSRTTPQPDGCPVPFARFAGDTRRKRRWHAPHLIAIPLAPRRTPHLRAATSQASRVRRSPATHRRFHDLRRPRNLRRHHRSDGASTPAACD